MKATKLCNLRCKYCYEWEHLSDTTRMSLEVWEHSFKAILEYSELAEPQMGSQIFTDIIWHGGEPLLLPTSYFADVLELQNNIFPPDWTEEGRISNCLQTNLYSVRDNVLDILKEFNFKVGVSFDFCSGVRLTSGGKNTENQVRSNLERLDAHDIPYEIIVVLAHHTASQIEYVFQELKTINVPARILPLFSGPDSRGMDGVAVSHDDIFDALFRMFKLWYEAGMLPKIHPFDECVQTIIMKRLGLQRPRHDRKILANEVLVIDRDGSLSSAAQRDTRIIGNIANTKISDIILSKEYHELVQEETNLKEEICDSCSYIGACDTSPIASNFDSFVLGDCVIDKRLLSMIEAYLDAHHVLGEDFQKTAQDMCLEYLTNEMGLELV